MAALLLSLNDDQEAAPASPVREPALGRSRIEKDGNTRESESDGKGGKPGRGKAENGKEGDDAKEKEGDDGKGGDDKKGDDKKQEDKPRSKWPIVIAIVVAVLAVIAGVTWWFLTRDQESTDDAYTEGNAVSIAPKVSGYVLERRVDDNSRVHAGDLMLSIDPRDYIAARDQAQANVELAKAQVVNAGVNLRIIRVRAPSDLLQARAQLEQARANEASAEREYRRQRSVDQRATTQTTVDQATSQFRSTSAQLQSAQAQLRVAELVQENIETAVTELSQRKAQLAQAQANLAQAELNLSWCQIRAPQDGMVTRRNVDSGTYAQVGQQVFYLVTRDVWVVANFKETQLARMRVGQKVSIAVDAYPKMKLHGHIESIQEGSGARFTSFPSENATGNFVKIVRRVPVKIVIDDGIDARQGLPLGLSVEPTVALK